MTTNLHPTVESFTAAEYLPAWAVEGDTWEPCEVVKVIPASKSWIGRITGGHTPILVIRTESDPRTFATPLYTVRSN